MPRRPAVAATLLLAGLCLAPLEAAAECTDPAAPEVDWRRCYMDGLDLTDSTLIDAQLRDTSFQRAILDGSDFTGADAYRSRFVSASLIEVDFTGANLQSADLTRADLTNAILVDANLVSARFVNAILVGADLTGADLNRAVLRNADLTGATWIDGETVCGPNSIGRCH